MADQFLNAESVVKKLNVAFSEHEKVIKASSEELDKLNKSYANIPSDYLKIVKSLNVEKEKARKTNEKLGESEKETKRLEQAVLRQREKLKQATSDAAKELVKLREETNKVNRELRQSEKEADKNTTAYKKLDIALTKVRNEAKNVGAEMFKLEREGKKNTLAYRKLDAEFQRLAKTTKILDKGLKDIDKSLGQNQREVGNYKIASENLHPVLGRVNSQLGMMGTSLDKLQGANGFKALSNSLISFGRATLAFLATPVGMAITAIGALFALISANKDTVIQFDKQLTNVGKTTGLAGNELDKLGSNILKLSKDLKVLGTPALLQYATVAGQLGVKGSANILNFTEALAKLETASNISGEEGAADIARLLTLTDGGVDNVSDFGDEIVKLGNNFAATEREILANATAIGQNVSQYKFGRQEVLAFAAATKSVGLEAEITGSTIGRTLSLMEGALRNGKGLAELTELTGLNVNELNKLLKKDSAEALRLLIAGLNRVNESGGSVNEQLEKIGINSIRDQRVISSLATKGFDVLTEALNDVTTASGALDEEFSTASNNLENRLGKFGIAWDNLVLSIEDGNGAIAQFFALLSEAGANVIDHYSDSISVLNGTMDEQTAKINDWNRGLNKLVPNIFGLRDRIQRGVDIMVKSNEEQKRKIAYLREEYKATDGLVTVLRESNIQREEDYHWILRGNDLKEDEVESKGRLRQIQEELSKLNEDLLDASREEIPLILRKITALNNERDALLGNAKATKKKRDEVDSLSKSYEKFLGQVAKQQEIADKKIKKLIEDLLVADTSGLKPLKKDTDDLIKSVIDLSDVFGSLNTSLGIDFTVIASLYDNFRITLSDAGQAAEDFGSIALDVFAAVTKAQNTALENQLRNLATQRNVEIEYAGNSAEARGQIEERFANEKRRIQEKQARNTKALSIMEATVAVAVAITKALGNPFLVALVSAIGAAQIGAIIATPIPAFKDGVRGFEGGKAIVGDGGKREPITDAKGNLIGISPNTPTLVDLPRGANVYSSESEFYDELNGILSKNGINTTFAKEKPTLTKQDIYLAMKKAIDGKETETIVMDKKGIKTYLVKENTRVQKLNNRASFKGGKI